MTSPEIGNYGISDEDGESRGPKVAGFIIRDQSPIASNWRSDSTLARLPRGPRHRRHLRHRHARADARAAVHGRHARHHRDRRRRSAAAGRGGARRRPDGGLRSRARRHLRRAVRLAARPDTLDEFSPDPERRAGRPLKVAAYDYGMKWNILRRFTAHGCDVRVFPADAPAADLLAAGPDGVFLSNGPGDPAALDYASTNARELVESDVPVFGICLGHQILSLAMGAETYKLKFGHRGANHPVKELETGKIEITSQNHGFAVDPKSLPSDVRVTHVNLYDETIEGLRHETKPVFCVQYHPEAAPGRTMRITCSGSSWMKWRNAPKKRLRAQGSWLRQNLRDLAPGILPEP